MKLQMTTGIKWNYDEEQRISKYFLTKEFINYGGLFINFTMEKRDRHELSQVMKMNISRNITNQSCELPFRAQLKEHNTSSVLFLRKMNNLILFVKKHQSSPNKEHSTK